MSHNCPDCGLEHGEAVIEVPEVDTEPVADAAVQIAEIEANRDVSVARIHAKTEEGWQEQRIVELEGKLAGALDALSAMAPPEPEPEPVPVVIEEPAPEPVIDEPTVEPPPPAEPAPKSSKRGNPWW